MNPTAKCTQVQSIPWERSATGVDGFSFRLFYDEIPFEDRRTAGRLWGPLTNICRFEPGTVFPPLRVADGVCEIWVRKGSLDVNGTAYETGDWLQLRAGDDGWALSSPRGCEILSVVRGRFQSLAVQPLLAEAPRKIRADEMPWKESPTGAPGCFSRKLFQYTSEGLGRDGFAGPYTTLYRLDAGSTYPLWRMSDGTCLVWVLRGSMELDGEEHSTDTFLEIPRGGDGWQLRSPHGCELLVIVQGRIELVRGT